MPSDTSHSPYRPAVWVLATVCSFFTIYLIIQTRPSPEVQVERSSNLHRSNALRRPRRRDNRDETDNRVETSAQQTDGATDPMGTLINALDGRETLADDETDLSFGSNEDSTGNSQNMLDLLYHIAGDTARREGYIHRGVECNSCGTCPIQGIRYHCANCWDYDLCENCEAGQVHQISHIFYKVRIPAPTGRRIKQVDPVWYPGRPHSLPERLPKRLAKIALDETGMDRTEVDALYDQFRCLAGQPWSADPSGLCMAIDRSAFDRYFTPASSLRKSPPNLIYDRIFAFYDTNNDGIIGFEEFLKGLANLQDKTRHAKILRIFKGYDIDGDGYVDRKDFLRMFRAYYALGKELNREMIANQEEDFVGVRHFIDSSQPISTAFTGANLQSHVSRAGVGKEMDSNGDLIVEDGNAALQEDLPAYGDRNTAIGNAAVGDNQPAPAYDAFRSSSVDDEPLISTSRVRSALVGAFQGDDTDEGDLLGEDPILQQHVWPPLASIEPEDISNALGAVVPLEEIMDPIDRSRVCHAHSQRVIAELENRRQENRNQAIEERWRRRHFYIDAEEGMTAPPGYTDDDSSDVGDEPDGKKLSPKLLPDSRRPSMRSRSSSKVRFEDDVTDTDYETRSNASSRSVPVGERWGGFEISETEKDIGKEILYQAVQQGFNQLLDPLFLEVENQWVAANATRLERAKWTSVIQDHELKSQKQGGNKDDALRAADSMRTDEIFASSEKVDKAIPDLHEEEAPAVTSAAEENSAGEIPEAPPRPEVITEGLRPSSPATLDLWVEHKKIDDQTKRRGGRGKLSIEEFADKMVPEDKSSESGGAPGDDQTGDKQWSKSASLGKLSFIGTWLEMASFETPFSY